MMNLEINDTVRRTDALGTEGRIIGSIEEGGRTTFSVCFFPIGYSCFIADVTEDQLEKTTFELEPNDYILACIPQDKIWTPNGKIFQILHQFSDETYAVKVPEFIAKMLKEEKIEIDVVRIHRSDIICKIEIPRGV